MKYFTISELCASSSAANYGIDNMPTSQITRNLTEMVEKLLDPLREAWGSGIKVTSGYRCTKLNTKVGGSATSAHCYGLAVDTKPSNGRMAEYQQFVEKFLREHKELGFDQLIHEYPDKNGVDSWVHIGYKNSSGKQRRHILTIN